MPTPAIAHLDVTRLVQEFPILQRPVHGKRLAFLDSGASSQKPLRVIEALDAYYRTINANVHRGVYRLSEDATLAFETAREQLAALIGAADPAEVIFVRNTTEAINLVANSWGGANIGRGDRILLTMMEHHSNIVPWQLLAQRVGATLDYLAVDGSGRLVLDDLEQQLTERTKLVALTHQSNVLGTINPVAAISARARAVGAKVLLDAAQSVPHMPINVAALDVDFVAFSGHKMLGPTGIGVLWGRRALLEAMPPFLGGGSMIDVVDLQSSTYAEIPARFEAGTPAIGEAIALGAAAEYLRELDLRAIQQHEHELTAYALQRLAELPGITVYGPPAGTDRGGAVSFTLAGVHPHDVAAVLDSEGVAVRAGHHCTQPLHRQLGAAATVRASFYLYNQPIDVDQLMVGLQRARRLFAE
jgi:cysteine desulfurase / selenocysteine lyase